MHATKNDLPILVEAGPAQVRGADWGTMRVALVSVPAGTDFGPLLKGLPNDRCQSSHWGYVIEQLIKEDERSRAARERKRKQRRGQSSIDGDETPRRHSTRRLPTRRSHPEL